MTKIAVKLPGRDLFVENIEKSYEGIKKHIDDYLDHGVLQEHRPDAFEPRMYLTSMSLDELIRCTGGQ